jgi:Phosphate-selective porin O and P
MNLMRRLSVPALAAGLLVFLSAGPAAAQWQIDSKDGNSNLKIGFLAQPQLEVIDTPDATGESKNVFLRRMRIMFGGKVGDKWTFFFETDDPNLGKATPDLATNPTGAKDAGNMYIQDAYVTYNASDLFKVDAGLILVPLGHNHNQSAATLLPVDYGPYSFTESGPLGSRVGRDYGVQLRGYPLNQHLEYRLGVFQGVRGPEARNAFRVAGRAVWYPFAADTGFFYGGTFQGSKRVVAIGAGFDTQKEYHSLAADAFIEQPLHNGQEGLTAQVNWMRFDGGTFLPALAKQDALLVEAGLHLFKDKVSPLVQYSRKTFDNPLTPTQYVWQAGVAYWLAGHQKNIKVTAGRQHTDGLPDRTQVLAQFQLFYF